MKSYPWSPICKPPTRAARKSHVVEHYRRVDCLCEEMVVAIFLHDPKSSLDSPGHTFKWPLWWMLIASRAKIIQEEKCSKPAT